MIPLSLTYKKTKLQTSRYESKGDSSEKRAYGDIGTLLGNYTSLWTFWADFMLVSRAHCSSHFITDGNVHKSLLYTWQLGWLWARTITFLLGVTKWKSTNQTKNLGHLSCKIVPTPFQLTEHQNTCLLPVSPSP